MFSTLRVLVVDDHPLFRAALCAMIDSTEGMEVAGEAADGLTAVADAGRLEPDVILMDLNMPDLDGVEATRRIVHASPHTGVLMLTMFENEAAVFAAMRAGAAGYLLKGAGQDEIVGAIRAVAAGQVIFGPGVARRMLRQLAGPGRPAEPFPELTTRERQVLELLAAGLSTTAVGARLGLAAKTVHNHASAIFAKLGVSGRAEAVQRARRAGLGGSP